MAQGDEGAFERHVGQVRTYNVDYGRVLPVSSRHNLIAGLSLVDLMGQNRIAEFLTELELIGLSARSDPYIDYALRLEHYLMEGSYSKMREEKNHLPHKAFGLFVTRLMDTVREEIADFCERSYTTLTVQAETKILSLDSR